MKKIILFILLVFSLNSIKAQFEENYTQNFFSTIEHYENYYDSLGNLGMTNQDSIGFKFFNRWKWTYLPKLSSFQGDWTEYKKALNAFYAYKESIINNTNPNAISYENATWEEMGPQRPTLLANGSSRGNGLTNFIFVHPADPNVMFACSNLGGVFKTSNANTGCDWVSTGTDNLPFTGCVALSTHSTDVNSWIIGQNKRGKVYKTNNNGLSYTDITANLPVPITPFWEDITVAKIHIDPADNGHAWVANSKGVFHSTLDIWTGNDPLWEPVMTMGQSDGEFFDMEIANNGDYIFALGRRYDGGADLYFPYMIYSLDHGTTWQVMNFTNPSIAYTDPRAWGNIELKALSPSKIYMTLCSRLSVNVQLFMFDLLTQDWTQQGYLPYPNIDHLHNPNSFAIDLNNENIVYSGNIDDVSKSTDFGVSWITTNLNSIHDDKQDFLFTNGGATMWAATDGGIHKSTDGGYTWTDTYNGLGIAAMWSNASTSQKGKPYLAYGIFHCGSQVYNPSDMNWYLKGGSDGVCTQINYDNSENFIVSGQIWNVKRYTSFGMQGTWNPPPLNNGSGYPWFTYFQLDRQNPNIIYASWDKICFSNTQGATNNWQSMDIAANFPGYKTCVLIKQAQNTKTLYAKLDPGNGTQPQRIIKTLDATGLPWTTFVDIPLIYGDFLSDFVVDDVVPDQLYFSFSRFGNGVLGTNKVIKYDGTTFIDMTYDIEPTVEVKCIEKQSGTNRIYIGTSDGVYYIDENQSLESWTKLGNFPNTGVGSMEINYCEKKIVVGTNGRGAWQTDLPEIEHNTIEIATGSNITWNSRVNLFQDVIIKKGAILNIQTDVHVYGDYSIIVEEGSGTTATDFIPGAVLNINGGTVISGCDKMWNGIIVKGDRTKNQYPQFGGNSIQGKLLLTNATIEGARDAVRVSDEYGKSGGIIQASNSTFKDNRRAIEFISYQNYKIGGNPSIAADQRPNLSFFKNCDFKTTKDLYEGYLPYSFVTMWEVSGIKLSGCRFSNTNPLLSNVNNAGRGIYTEDAHFIVEDYCTSLIFPCPVGNTIHSGFLNLAVGVNATKVSANRPFSVTNSSFDNCVFGVFSTGVSNMNIKNNNFQIGSFPQDNLAHVGIGLLYNMTGYNINNNTVEENTSPIENTASYGIWNLNTGPTSKVLKNNTFIDLQVGIQAELRNRSNSPLGPIGLEFQCNINQGGDYDFYVMKGLLANPSNTTYGIKDFQGMTTFSEGNKFSNNGTQFDFRNTSGNQIDYYFYNNAGASTENPTTISPSITKWPILIQNNCNSSNGVETRSISQMTNDYVAVNQQYLLYKGTLQALIDGGNTPGLKSTVITSNTNQTLDLRLELLGNSPYLSEDVLKDASDKTEVLPEAILFEILMANPNALKKPGLMKHLKDKAVPLPEWMLLLLEANKGQITLRSLLESAISRYNSQRSEIITEIISHYESLEELRDESEIRGWYAQYDTYQADFSIVESYISEGNYNAAEDFLATISTARVMDKVETEDLANYELFIMTYLDLKRNGKQINSLDTTDVQMLENIANTSDEYIGSIKAKVLLNFFYGYNYSYQPTPPELEPKEMEISIPINSENNIDVYPIPATDWIAFSYQMMPDLTNGVLEIYNSLGAQLAIVRLGNSSGVFVADVSQYVAGMYTYRITNNGEKIFSGTVIIQ